MGNFKWQVGGCGCGCCVPSVLAAGIGGSRLLEFSENLARREITYVVSTEGISADFYGAYIESDFIGDVFCSVEHESSYSVNLSMVSRAEYLKSTGEITEVVLDGASFIFDCEDVLLAPVNNLSLTFGEDFGRPDGRGVYTLTTDMAEEPTVALIDGGISVSLDIVSTFKVADTFYSFPVRLKNIGYFSILNNSETKFSGTHAFNETITPEEIEQCKFTVMLTLSGTTSVFYVRRYYKNATTLRLYSVYYRITLGSNEVVAIPIDVTPVINGSDNLTAMYSVILYNNGLLLRHEPKNSTRSFQGISEYVLPELIEEINVSDIPEGATLRECGAYVTGGASRPSYDSLLATLKNEVWSAMGKEITAPEAQTLWTKEVALTTNDSLFKGPYDIPRVSFRRLYIYDKYFV